jgi:hypothetical protein
MVKPNFFIAGAPKCGTTAMNDYLAQHPDVFMARKEIHYFGRDLKLKQKMTEAEYLENFQQPKDKKIVGEASVWYLYSQEAAQEIKSFSPNAKILIMLRNPVEMIYSLHSQHLYDGNEDVPDFETAISLDEERKKGNCLPDSADFIRLPPYIDAAFYYPQVKRYLEAFGPDNVKVVLYDDFVNNTEKTVVEVLSFLHLKPATGIDYKIVNPNKHIKSFFIHRVIKKPSHQLKKVMRAVLPFQKIRHVLMKQLLNWNVKYKKRKPLKDDVHNSLKRYFTKDITLLGQLINKDLSKWLA